MDDPFRCVICFQSLFYQLEKKVNNSSIHSTDITSIRSHIHKWYTTVSIVNINSGSNYVDSGADFIPGWFTSASTIVSWWCSRAAVASNVVQVLYECQCWHLLAGPMGWIKSRCKGITKTLQILQSSCNTLCSLVALHTILNG